MTISSDLRCYDCEHRMGAMCNHPDYDMVYSVLRPLILVRRNAPKLDGKPVPTWCPLRPPEES